MRTEPGNGTVTAGWAAQWPLTADPSMPVMTLSGGEYLPHENPWPWVPGQLSTTSYQHFPENQNAQLRAFPAQEKLF